MIKFRKGGLITQAAPVLPETVMAPVVAAPQPASEPSKWQSDKIQNLEWWQTPLKFKRRDVLKGHMEKCANKSSQAQQAQQQAAAQAAVQAAINSGNSTSPGLPALSGAASPLAGSSPLPIVPPPIINNVNSTISPFTPPPSSSSA